MSKREELRKRRQSKVRRTQWTLVGVVTIVGLHPLGIKDLVGGRLEPLVAKPEAQGQPQLPGARVGQEFVHERRVLHDFPFASDDVSHDVLLTRLNSLAAIWVYFCPHYRNWPRPA